MYKLLQTPETTLAVVCPASQRTKSLKQTRTKMNREIARRKAGEREFAKNKKHFRRLLARSQLAQNQSQALAQKVLLSQEKERKEISRELHEGIAQILTGINVHLAALSVSTPTDNRDTHKRINRTQRLVQRCAHIVHSYARKLRPAVLDDLGLIPALRSCLRDLAGATGPKVQFTAFVGVESLTHTERTVIYRVAQEAFINALRHACAKTVAVVISETPTGVSLAVHDDGISFTVDRVLGTRACRRFGLLGMRARVEMVGGIFSVNSSPGMGTTVRAEIPFRSKRSN